MRVGGGIAGGIPLVSPRTDLRPTMEMVKNAIFNSLAAQIPGSRVLDLFAGNGGLGIEALSRGAASAVFVENNRLAVESIHKNLQKTRLENGVVENMDVFKWLSRAPEGAFDFVFADPPYAKVPGERDFGAELLESSFLPRVLAPEGIFVLEHLPNAKLELHGRWTNLRQKRYGATSVVFLALA